MDGDLAITAKTTDLTRALAERAVAVRYESLPDSVRELARQCVLDYYGVALAGADDPLAHILLDELAEAGGAEQAGIIGHNARLPVLAAARSTARSGMRSTTTTSTWRCRAIPRSRSCPASWPSPSGGTAPGAR